jgi:polyferredoxin
MTGEGRQKKPWTLRRAFRWAGIIMLAATVLMALFGAYGLKTTVPVKMFFFYWTIFFVLLWCTIALATFDALLTIVRFRKEHKKLRESIGRQLRGESDTNSQANLN